MSKRIVVWLLAGFLLATVPPTEAQQPEKFEFIVNLTVAKQIGLTLPQDVLARADKVI
jgi:ABC-type uncharacterized transport system substrate-binding protein